MLLKFPCVRHALEQTRARKVTIHMMSFGGSTSKGLWLVGTAPWLEELQEVSRENRPEDTWTLGALSGRDEHGRVTGVEEDLRESEEYTPQFTEAWFRIGPTVLRLFQSYDMYDLFVY